MVSFLFPGTPHFQGKTYNCTPLVPWIQQSNCPGVVALRSILCQGERHGVGSERGEQGRERGRGRLWEGKYLSRVGGTGMGTGKGRGWCNWVRQQGETGKMIRWYGCAGVWGFYAGEGADTVWDL